MYNGALVVTLAACPYLFQLDWLSQSYTAAVCVWSCFITLLRLRCRKLSNIGTLSSRDICFFNRNVWRCHCIENYGLLSGTKLSKRAEKMLKTTLVLEDQSRQHMIKMWKWCELWWRKTANWVSGWLQKKRAWMKMRFIESNNRRWIMGIRLQSWDQMAKWGMAHEKFSLSEESMHGQIQGENYDYCFFRQPWHCAQRICTSRTDS